MPTILGLSGALTRMHPISDRASSSGARSLKLPIDLLFLQCVVSLLGKELGS